MGLDMYLYRRRYVKNWNHSTPEEKTEVTLKVGGKVVPLTDPVYIWEQVGCWRKANEIHKFFVDLDDGKDECQPILVDSDNLKSLYKRCQQVLADRSLAVTLLPTQGGFFFGGTEYGDYYFEDLKDTIKIIEPLLDESDEFIYQASW